MAYTEIETFQKRMWPGTNQQVEQRYINEAADMVKNVIDAALYGVFTGCPWSTTPAFIETISDMMVKDVAIALKSQGGVTAIFGDETTAGVAMAEKWLNDLRAGRKELIGESRSATVEVTFEFENYHPIHDIDDELNHFPDSDRLDAIDQGRE